MDLNLGYITGSTVEMGYTGAYAGGATINNINTNNTGDQYQQVTATISGFAGDITGFTVGAANGVVVDGTVAGGTVTLRLPGDLATGTYNATVFNGTESALISFAFTQTHSYTSPYGLVDSNSAFFDQVLTEFSYHRVAVPFSNGVLDAAGAEAGSLWGNDLNDIYTPDAGYSGTDTATFEILYADGTTAQWVATVAVTEPGVDTTPAPFTVTPLTNQPLNEFVEFAPITVADIDAGEEIAVVVTGTDVEYAVSTGSGYAAFTSVSTNVQVGHLVKPRIRTSAQFSAAATGSIAIGSESSSLSATTRAAVLPALTLAIPDLNFGQGDTVSLDLNTYFSGATSYALTGLPAGSGLSFSGSQLTGTTSANDIAASPFTLIAEAFSADGSITDAFAVTVLGDAPVIAFSAPLTTTDTSPTVSGTAGAATSITLTVNGQTYTPAVTSGQWSQQLPTLALNSYPMTLNGEDAEGVPAEEVQATLLIIEAVVNAGVAASSFRFGF